MSCLGQRVNSVGKMILRWTVHIRREGLRKRKEEIKTPINGVSTFRPGDRVVLVQLSSGRALSRIGTTTRFLGVSLGSAHARLTLESAGRDRLVTPLGVLSLDDHSRGFISSKG